MNLKHLSLFLLTGMVAAEATLYDYTTCSSSSSSIYFETEAISSLKKYSVLPTNSITLTAITDPFPIGTSLDTYSTGISYSSPIDMYPTITPSSCYSAKEETRYKNVNTSMTASRYNRTVPSATGVIFLASENRFNRPNDAGRESEPCITILVGMAV